MWLSVSWGQQGDTTAVAEGSRNVYTVGVAQGSALIGADWEYRVSDKLGVQVGAGLVGFALAAVRHPNSGTRGRLISVVYKNSGGRMSTIGPEFIFRFGEKKLGLSAQLGLGLVLSVSDEVLDFLGVTREEYPPVILTYAIGVTF